MLSGYNSCDRAFVTTLATECMALPGSIIPIKCDLRIREDIETMFCVIKEKLMGVDVCINNAGLALDAPIIDGGYDAWEEMWHVNVRAVCICTHLSVKSMLDRGVDDGHIININSCSSREGWGPRELHPTCLRLMQYVSTPILPFRYSTYTTQYQNNCYVDYTVRHFFLHRRRYVISSFFYTLSVYDSYFSVLKYLSYLFSSIPIILQCLGACVDHLLARVSSNHLVMARKIFDFCDEAVVFFGICTPSLYRLCGNGRISIIQSIGGSGRGGGCNQSPFRLIIINKKL
ncbi:uncharacterized protein LOC125671651 isoform X3 [Ostrea edulis]|uniref:uncharacterized protein LOC125671651 isoform X3 n=1 Tax=Ostrea edulis TaxID=37623 RepID=UPI0024AEC1DA|nr:uncharacterized protein LOC125671651 isoform X3 [Ostrea edulis]